MIERREREKEKERRREREKGSRRYIEREGEIREIMTGNYELVYIMPRKMWELYLILGIIEKYIYHNNKNKHVQKKLVSF